MTRLSGRSLVGGLAAVIAPKTTGKDICKRGRSYLATKIDVLVNMKPRYKIDIYQDFDFQLRIITGPFDLDRYVGNSCFSVTT